MASAEIPPTPPSLDPWEMGRAYAAESGEMPSQAYLTDRWGVSRRQGLLFCFGFAEGHGQKFPPFFRQKLEWLCRIPTPIDDDIIAIDSYAIGMDENDKLIFRSLGGDTMLN
ncbi:MAG: hypothetical protein QOD42_1882 [Sphingomonadales bacterium]|nr:hypothetical protein [Sphingomonadales bacterium]